MKCCAVRYVLLLVSAVGKNRLATAAVPIVLKGTAGNDKLTGAPDTSSIFGLGGSDKIYAYGGADIISGGGGDDYIKGSGDNDFIHGGAGNDYVVGNRADDHVWGGAGNDRVTGSHSNDVLYGEAGIDYVIGGIGNDIIFGGAGADSLHGGKGWDSLNDASPGLNLANDGNDKLYADWSDTTVGHNTLNPGTGVDVIILTRGTGPDVVNFKASNILKDFNAARAPDVVKFFHSADDLIYIRLDNSLTASQFAASTSDSSMVTLTVGGVKRDVFQVVGNDIAALLNAKKLRIVAA